MFDDNPSLMTNCVDDTVLGNATLQSRAINRDGGSGYVFSRVSGQPHDQAADGGWLYPLRKIRSGHCLAVGGSVHGAGQNYIGRDAGVLVLDRDGADQ